MKIKEQLDVLAAVGLTLSEGVTIDDLLISFSEKEFEDPPFDLLLTMLGSEVEAEPYGRPFSTFACTVDMNGIHGDGDYTLIAERLRRLSGEDLLFKVAYDHVDVEKRAAQLRYEALGQHVDFTPEVIDSWTDAMIVTKTLRLIKYLQSGVKDFYFKLNGTENVFYYLSKEQGDKLIEVGRGSVELIDIPLE
jgi:hypothetical protein